MGALISGKQILITGGAGFIGTALIRRLVDDNRITVYDSGHRGRLSQDLVLHPNLLYTTGDVLDLEALKRSMQGCNLVLHLAAVAGVDSVLRAPVKTMEIGIIGTYNALEAARAQGNLSRFLHFSTSEVFGRYAYKVHEGEATSLGAVGEARWTYAVSKLASEHMAINYFKEFKVPAVSLRPFNVYGPGQIGEGAIHHFVVRALKGEPLLIHNDGSQIRAWCYIDDIVNAILLCLTNDEAVGQVFNIGNPRSIVTIYELARQISRLTGSSSKIEFVKRDYPDVELRIPNIEKARRLLGYEPKVDLDEGLARTIDWYRSQLQDHGAAAT